MAFHFALDPLLRLRQSVERQRSLLLQEATLQLRRAEEELARFEQFLTDSALADFAGLAAGCSGAELHFAHLYGEQLQTFRLQLQNEVERSKAVRQQVLTAYQQAVRERELLETLRSSQHRAYRLEQSRQQQQELDTNFLLRSCQRREG